MNTINIEEKMRSIKTQADDIMSFFDDKGRVTQDNVPKAQHKFQQLKALLQSEYKRMQSNKIEKQLSREEQVFYRPAIGDAWANTQLSSIRKDSRPSQAWFNALFDVTNYMGYWLNQLNSAQVK